MEPFRILARADELSPKLRDFLDGDVRLELAAAWVRPNGAWVSTGSSDAEPEVVVVGPVAKQPLAAAREARERWPGCQLLFLLPTDRLERFRASLPFVSHLADAWTADVSDPPEIIHAAILEAARAARRRRATAVVFERINRQLESTATTESPEAQRRRRQLALSDRYLATLLTQVPDAILAIDATNAVIAWNDAATRLFGFSLDAAMGYQVLRLFTSESRGDVESLLALARAGEVVTQREVTIVSDGGKELYAELSLAPVREDDGRIVSLSVTVRDISDRKRAENELRRLNETLEERVAQAVAAREAIEERLRHAQKLEVVGQLTGGIAHDFNNLLTAIAGNIQLLDNRLPPADETGRRRLNAALHGVDKAAALTQRLLAFARRQALQPKPLDINNLVNGLSELLHRTLGEMTVIETVLAEGLWLTLADPNQLENALLNLAVNARDAMPEGGKLRIETANANLDQAYAAEVEPGQYVMLAVADTGVGMSKDTLEKAFEPFYTTKEVGKGSGLGLSQVYGFVRQSNGHVEIESALGQGTTVKIYLPRHHAPAPELATLERERSFPSCADGQVILVVEDNDDVREFTVTALRQLGYRVLEARDAATAVRELEGRRDVALLFTDVVLPGMNGQLLAAEARRLRPDLKVLLTTGYARDTMIHDGRPNHSFAMIKKPFTLEGLAAKLREVIDT